MNTLPLFAKLAGRRCLVVGGGQVASRRVDQLLRAGASITVVAPEIGEAVRALAETGDITLIERRFEAAMASDCWLIVAATNDDAANRQVAEAAEAAATLCNVVDQPELCSFIMPAIVDRSPITIAISSGGETPVLTRWLKGLIEETLPNRIGALASLAGRWRDRVRTAIPNLDDRQRFWHRALTSEVADRAFAGQEDASEAALEAALDRWLASSERETRQGQAYLIGAGPGDPELITLRGRKLLAQADVVLYDRLVNPEILDYARRDAEKISVGKAAGKPSMRQEQISRLLVNLVGCGKHVCRLKGGDPMVFGRISEELEALTEAGLPFQIVPGVSAVEGCAAYAGIPLTMRDEARAVLIATGHTTDHNAADLGAYRADQTLALYMAIANFGPIAKRLLELGHPPDLPLAVVESGTTRKQRIVQSTLSGLETLATEYKIQSPALLLIGQTVRYADRYGWFNPRILNSNPDKGLANAS